MDEASSKYLDTIVMSKLLEERLEKVSHKPQVSPSEIEQELFADLDTAKEAALVNEIHGSSDLELISPVNTTYESNRTCRIKLFPAEQASASIILVHGLYEDNRDIYSFLIKGLNEIGYSVHLMTLPYHFERTPDSSLFSGEYFWSADISRTRSAYKQAVYELYQFYTYLKESSALPVYLSGFSMGAAVSLTLLSLVDDITALFAINPPSGLSDIVWDSPLCRTIKRDFLDHGYSEDDLQRAFASLEPKSQHVSSVDVDRLCLAYALYDQVTEQYHYENIKKEWNLIHTIEYKAGHLNTLRVPRLARDMDTFFKSRTAC